MQPEVTSPLSDDDSFVHALLQLRTEKMSVTAVKKFKSILYEPSSERWLELAKYANCYDLTGPDEFLVTLQGTNDTLHNADDLLPAYLDLECAQRLAEERKLWWSTVSEVCCLVLMLLFACGVIFSLVVQKL